MRLHRVEDEPNGTHVGRATTFAFLGEKRRKARTMAAVLLAKLCFRCVVRFSDREYMRWGRKTVGIK